jgi:chromosome segregation protein
LTKINRISIQGFKSFAHKTDILLGNRYNCILGPNGSGKSNVGDALCFVLGRLSAKSMRAEKAANLIFNGGKKHKVGSTGTVEIEFDNQNKVFPVEDKEIIVSRTITKSGSSIYKINNKKHTRTQILDLLSSGQINPEGYNIILQGDIMRFVDMPSVERRKIIEQISDISHYEEKKKKAMQELTKVEEKLGNAEIILKERKAYLKELKKDRDQALKFKEVQDKIDQSRATHIHLQMESKNIEKTKFDTRIEELKEKVAKSEEKVKTFRTQIEEQRSKINEINTEIEQKGEKEQVKVHQEIEDLKTIVIQNKARLSTLQDEMHKIDQRKVQFQAESKELIVRKSEYAKKLKELEKLILQKTREAQELENKTQNLRKKNNLGSVDDIEVQLSVLDKEIDSKQEEILGIRTNQQECLRQKDKIEYQLESIDEQIKKVKEISQQNKEQVKELQNKKNAFKTATLRLNTSLDHESGFIAQLSNARRSLVDLQEKHAKLNARTQSVQAHHTQNMSVSALLKNKKQFPGVYGTVAQLGQVQKKYSQALEAAASGRTNFVVVKDDRTAAECIAFLKQNKLGSASFIPLNKIKTHSISQDDKTLLKQQGVHDFALNLVTFKSEYKRAFSYVFGNSVVVDDMNAAKTVGIGRIRMATLDGSIAESSGVMRGGFKRRTNSGFAEKDSLEELDKFEAYIAEKQSVISSIEVKRQGNEQDISSLRKLKGELEGDIITLEKTLHLGSSDLDATSDLKKELNLRDKELESQMREVQKQIAYLNKDLTVLKTNKDQLRSKITMSKNPRILAELSAFDEGRQKCRETIIRSENDMKNINSQMKQIIDPEVEKFAEIIKQHDKEKEQFVSESSNLSSKLKVQVKDLDEKEKASKAFYSQYKELFNRREKFNSLINAAESSIDKYREGSRNHEREMNIVSLKNAEVKAKLSVLDDQFEKFKEVELFKNRTEEELRKEIAKFEVVLSQMDAVNMKALEKYDEVELQFNSLVEKKDSLHSEKTDVLTLMNEIETKKKEHFMKTFNATNKHFKDIFSRLFTKGDAFLHIENKDNPFEDGLSVKVKLTGKRHMDIKSLSGGEKTLTALAFIFAVQEHQPARFYVLDEIDAALDKHNSEKLAKLIAAYSNKAQYLVISHNDSVISEADTLYGVSMKDGISKITSLKI